MKKIILAASTVILASASLSAAQCSTCGTGPQYRAYGKCGRYSTEYNYNPRIYDSRNNYYLTATDHEILMDIQKSLEESQFDNENNNVHVIVEYGKVILKGRVVADGERDNLEQIVANVPRVRNVVVDVYVDDRQNRREGRGNGASGQNGTNGNRSNQNTQNGNGAASGWWNRGGTDAQNGTNGNRSNQNTQNGKGNGGTKYYERQQNDSQASDMDLKQKVKNALSGRWFSKNYDNVEVQVSNRTVTLTGFVDSPHDKNDAENKVRGITEIRDVRNMIEIRPASSGTRQSPASPSGNTNRQNPQY